MDRTSRFLLALLLPALGCGDTLEAELAPPGDAPVELERGVLSPPSTDPPEVVAARFAATRPRAGTGELAVKRQQGGVVSMAQRHAGREVVGGGYAVRVGADGAVRWARDRRKPLPADLPVAPTVAADRAEARARVASGLPAHIPARVEEVIYALAGPGRLAYRVRFARDPGTNQAIESFVDATTGDVLHAQDLVLYEKQARVYEENPWTTPELSQVTLGALPAGATVLEDADFDVRTCVDEPTCTEFESGAGGGFWLNLCELEHLVTADAGGDFFVEPPAKDTEVEDPFAEVQLYFGLQRAVAFFRSIGLVDGLRTRPMLAVANYRDDAWLCEGPTTTGKILDTFNNAFFSPDGLLGHPGSADTLAFGNGSSVDFSYDSDVVTHELGHALIHTVSDLGRIVPRTWGLDATGWAMHEGLADYFAIARSNDATLAEWVGVKDDYSVGLRDLRVDRIAWQPEIDPWPVGQPHEDGSVLAAALWDVRESLAPADRPAMDAAILAATSALGPDDGFETAAPLFVAELEAAVGASAAATATTIFAARGISELRRIQEIVPPEFADINTSGYWWVIGWHKSGAAPAPQMLQWRVEVTEAAPRLTFDVGGGGCQSVSGYLKAGAPVSWDFAAQPVTNDADEVVTGHAAMVDAAMTFDGPFPAGTYYLQLENTSAFDCELAPSPIIGDGESAVAYVTDEELPEGGHGETPDNECDLSDPGGDPDCSNQHCDPELPDDPDCGDGTCVPGNHGDPDCMCGEAGCVDQFCSGEPGDPDCVSDGECDGRVENDPDCVACAEGSEGWPACLEDGTCDEAHAADDPDCDGDGEDDGGGDGPGADGEDDGGGCAAAGGSTGPFGLALLLVGLAPARRRRTAGQAS